MKHARLFAGTMFAALASTAFGMAFIGGPSYDLSWHTVDGGGGVSSGGSFELHGTIGQHDAGPAMAGGDFSLAGGFWAGGGPTSSPAVLTDVATTWGTHLSGDLTDLLVSDDSDYRVNSNFGFQATEAYLVQMTIGAATNDINASTITVQYEARLSNPGGTAKIAFKNWDTLGIQDVHIYPIGMSETIEVTPPIDATDRIRASDGRIEMRIKHSVVTTFSATGFVSETDWVDVTVQ